MDSNFFTDADNAIDDVLADMGIGVSPTLNAYTLNAQKSVDEFTRNAFKEGWQWSISTSDPNAPDLNICIKDVNYGVANVDVDVQQIASGSIALPTFGSVGEITMTVRDTQDNAISKWICERIKLMSRDDGSQSLPIEYLMRLDIHTLDYDAEIASSQSFIGNFIKLGDKNHTRDSVSTFDSFPAIFQRFTNLDFDLPDFK